MWLLLLGLRLFLGLAVPVAVGGEQFTLRPEVGLHQAVEVTGVLPIHDKRANTKAQAHE